MTLAKPSITVIASASSLCNSNKGRDDQCGGKSDVGNYGGVVRIFFKLDHVIKTTRGRPRSFYYVRTAFAFRLPCRPSWRTVCVNASHINERSNLSLNQMIPLGIP